MVRRLFGIIMLVKLLQLWNTKLLILVNELFVGKVTLAKLEQPWNAVSPMVRTLFGIITLAKLVQLRNALETILVMVEPIVTPAKLERAHTGTSPV
jgi:hypothetical protein